MTKRQDSGGTTALVIVCTLVVVLVGVAFFVWMKIIGGGKELQHATDSGNLNVAKQALKSPGIALSSADESNEFGDLVDPSTGQVDLLAYDRLVGKCVLVALNASAEGSDEARTNAEKILAMVEGTNGIGSRLASQLSQHNNTSGFFTDMTSKASTRMLQSDGQVQANAEETAVSFMARQKASNVFIDGQQVPPEVQDFLSNSNNIVKKNNKQYIAGYTPLAITNLPSVQAQAVPMRPGEQPHLVNVDDFHNLNQSPLGGNSSFIPPNAFRSGGSSIEGNATNANLKMRSCAIVGTLNQDFPVSIPRGYIKIDNTGSMDFSGTTGGGQTALANILMQPSYVGLVNGPSGDVFGKPGTVEGVLDFVNQHKSDNPQPPVPANETTENGGGRVFFTATDQDGNFRVGDLFAIEQSTGVATLNADAFNISGLQELNLGNVTLGGGSATITEFSTDPFFTADSDNIVPTQRAIKAYIASQIGGGGASLNVNSVTAGSIFISSNIITTTTTGPIKMNATFEFRGGVTGYPLAFNYFLN